MNPSHGSDDLLPRCRFRLAVTGKGGVGKTVIAAMIVRRLKEQGHRVLLVDGDPAMGLAYMFAADTSKTIGAFRDQVLNNPKVKRELESAQVKEIMIRDTLINLDEQSDLLIMGADEGEGCFCGINTLLKYGIGSIAKDYDAMVIDCEAGLEQVRRRVLHQVNLLLIISDMSARGLKTASHLAKVVGQQNAEVVLPEMAGLIINRYKGVDSFVCRAKSQTGLKLLATIPEDEHISEIDLNGLSIDHLPSASASYVKLTELLEQLTRTLVLGDEAT
ncbi:MAG: AAA family ATPase [Proteobacteria bacterium]|nr:AAA family ATPase [Pseudomonadota bacterium]MBU1452481.1 AAA family ATPase [Pseudomonadota bacterium]MBU2468289.1 AAA family ATPase [Pseudomonadota bacterium]MBU2518161.1 AAA family ATPase [Pseudomonadota bacterium]